MKKESVGEILCQIEVLVNKLFDQHEFQWGDWLWNQFGWLKIHRPGDREHYKRGGHPTFHYGYRDRKQIKKKLLKLLETWESSRLDGKCADEILDLIDKEDT